MGLGVGSGHHHAPTMIRILLIVVMMLTAILTSSPTLVARSSRKAGSFLNGLNGTCSIKCFRDLKWPT